MSVWILSFISCVACVASVSSVSWNGIWNVVERVEIETVRFMCRIRGGRMGSAAGERGSDPGAGPGLLRHGLRRHRPQRRLPAAGGQMRRQDRQRQSLRRPAHPVPQRSLRHEVQTSSSSSYSLLLFPPSLLLIILLEMLLEMLLQRLLMIE